MNLRAQHEPVLAETRGQTRILILNRPEKRNVIGSEVYLLLHAMLDEAESDADIANIVITGAGGFFSAGGDLNSLGARAGMPPAEREATIEALHAMIRRVRHFPKSVIAAVEGGAAGAGASLAFAADFLVAAADSFISLAHVRTGLIPDGGGSFFLAQVLPPQLGKEIAVLGDRFPATRLAELGLVNRLAPSGEALTVALDFAATLAAGPPAAQARILSLIDAPFDAAFAEHLDRERRAMGEALGAAEAAEGIRAFRERRIPAFSRPARPISQASGAEAAVTLETRVTRLFGCRLPIVAGGLMWLADANYVAAAAKAGIMGFITAASFPDPEALRNEIRRCRELCGDLPFGVNISMLPKLVEGDRTRSVFELVAEEQVGFVETSGRSPEPYLDITRSAGIKVLHKTANLRHAQNAERIGVDAVTIVGAECGGHPGQNLIGSLVNAGLAARRLTLPWLIGGGVGIGAQVAAILTMGGSGAVVGTRFLVADEIWAHADYKAALIAASENDTALGMHSVRNTVRALANETMAELARIEAENPDVTIADLMPLVSGRHSYDAYRTGDTRRGVLSVGQILGAVAERAPLAEIVRQMERELIAALADAARLIGRA